ncbi:matrilin-4 [Callorhinchus milii]|uniref:Matrilin 4 n=1 Tax=Callorhinchus milii TaxID=7868 RepID=V9KII0_CALMI|nr:matrilin-4 [Callorhinchus milii]XP_007909703.1 matrilin-4 [Callorhinchus milii]XP_007909704.1 matrilin-4 [Callorhinchus milii]|eukprot:gi/632985471/ref/XP_007909702.1/ PREDICTED: matrilin-4 [Callorhinchus milii]
MELPLGKLGLLLIAGILSMSGIEAAQSRPARNRLIPGAKCSPGPTDLVFIIDSSRSVRPFEFEQMRKFIVDMIDFLHVGPEATRVGLVQYSSQIQNIFSLKTYQNKVDMIKSVNEFIPLAQGTMTGLAIQYAMNIAFTEAEGARPLRQQIPRVAIIVTDGRPQDRVTEVAARAREAGIEIYAVGVRRAEMSSLRAMASPPLEEHVFLVETFDLIEQFAKTFQDKLCGQDLCAQGNHGCQHVCVSSPGSYHCVCREGFILNQDKKTCKAIDLCSTGDHDCEQICLSSPGSYRCQCRKGFTLNRDQKTCSPIDFCADGTHGCEHICVSSPGSYHCRCRAGFTLNQDKKTCTMVDYCSFGNHSCQHECVNILSGYFCKCREGFELQGDGKRCKALDACSTVEHGCEYQCVSTPGSYFCICPEGRQLNLDGKSCNKCSKANIDLVFVIDGSKSVRPQNFELVKEFVNNIVDALDISSRGTRVGLVQYSSRVRTEFPLSLHATPAAVKNAVNAVEYMEKGTMTGLSLKHMVENSFSEAEGARANVPRVGLVFTDGRSQDSISEWARKAKEAGISMYAVGVGKAVEDELREIASDPVDQHFFYASDFNAIDQIAESLKLNICEEEATGQETIKDPCACETLVAFQHDTLSMLDGLSEKLAQMTVKLEDLENRLPTQ